MPLAGLVYFKDNIYIKDIITVEVQVGVHVCDVRGILIPGWVVLEGDGCPFL